MNNDNIKLAYAGTIASNSSGYIGAVLISDYKGFPLEFRYTDPIVPTKIQQVLYGEGLEKYIKLDVIADSLIKSLSNKASILIVQDEDLLEFKGSNIAIVRISSTKTPPLSQPGELTEVKKAEYMLQTSHANNPIRIQFNQNFDCQSEAFNSVITTITEAGNFMDVDEPLNRIYKTLELICNQEV